MANDDGDSRDHSNDWGRDGYVESGEGRSDPGEQPRSNDPSGPGQQPRSGAQAGYGDRAAPGARAGPGGGPGAGPQAGGGGGAGIPQHADDRPISDDEKLWGMLSHVCFFVFGIIGPALILGLHDKIIDRESEFVRHHAKQALFWQIAAIIVATVTCGVGALVMMIWPVLAAIAASEREWYSYPLIGDMT